MNVKDELISFINYHRSGNMSDILCANIKLGETGGKEINLTTGWDNNDLMDFLNNLNFNYDSGYGSQNLFGNIWFIDGTWASRGEYDGSEWWEYNICPEIPQHLNRIDKVREQKINKIIR